MGSVQQEVGSVQQEVGSVQQEVGSVQQEVGSVQQEVGSVQQEVGSVQQEVGSVQQEVGARVAEQAEVSLVTGVEPASVALADASEVVQHLGEVVARDAGGDSGIGDEVLDGSTLQDVGRVVLQRFVMPHRAVADLTRRTQLREAQPVHHQIPKLPVQPVPPRVAQVTHKVIEAKAGSPPLAVGPSVLAHDGGGDVMFVPGLEARV